MIVGKINCSKIEKARLFQGEKGKYLDIALIETSDDQYGNHFVIIQQVSKDERLAGTKGAILGNAKWLGQPPTAAPKAAPAGKTATTMNKPAGDVNLDEDVPF
jgi:hypothetical protein